MGHTLQMYHFKVKVKLESVYVHVWTAIKNFFFRIAVQVDNKEKGELQGMQLLCLQPCFCHVGHIWPHLCTVDFDMFASPQTLDMFPLIKVGPSCTWKLSLGGKGIDRNLTIINICQSLISIFNYLSFRSTNSPAT